jgi:mycothiol synthase
MGDGITIRSPRPEEAVQVADLLNAHAEAETGAPDTTAEEVAASWDRPDREPADLLVAVEDARVVGYLEVDARPPWTSLRIDGYVHPGLWGRGLGSTLLSLGEERAREVAGRAAPGERVVVFHGVWRGGPGGPLLKRHGFALSRVYHRMRIDMSEHPPPPRWPQGIAVRSPVPGEEPAIHTAMEEAFGDHWEHRPVTFDRWLHDYRTHPGYDPSLWFLAVDGDDIAGGVICERLTSEEPDCAWVDDVAVRRPWRRRGVALALLLHAFGVLYRQGIRKAALTVDSDSPTGATGLYQRAGMRVERSIDVFGKEIVPAVAGHRDLGRVTPGA